MIYLLNPSNSFWLFFISCKILSDSNGVILISSEVNTSSKFLTSNVPDISGINSACISFLNIPSKSTPEKNGWDLISLKPSLHPNLVDGFLSRSF